MIKSNLGEILEQRKLSINKVSTETGISRQTITSLANNESKGIQFNTLDTLMAYLDVELTDLLIDTEDEILICIQCILFDKEKGFVKEEAENTITLVQITMNEGGSSSSLYFTFNFLTDKNQQGQLAAVYVNYDDTLIKNHPVNVSKFNKILHNISKLTAHKLSSLLLFELIKHELKNNPNTTFSDYFLVTWILPEEQILEFLSIEIKNNKVIILPIKHLVGNDYDKKITLFNFPD